MRWIFPGQAGPAVAGWFGRFPAAVASREDAYLVDPQLRGLSVKIRGGGALEVKVYRGSPGILQVAGWAHGRMESWQKWSFPGAPLSPGGAAPPGWVPVHKRISQFPAAGGQIRGRVTEPGAEPGCMVELTEVHSMAGPGGPWGSRPPAPPACSAANWRPPPRSCSTRPCPMAWNWTLVTPSPMPNGSAGSQAPAPALTPDPQSPVKRRWTNGGR